MQIRELTTGTIIHEANDQLSGDYLHLNEQTEVKRRCVHIYHFKGGKGGSICCHDRKLVITTAGIPAFTLAYWYSHDVCCEVKAVSQ